MNKNVPDSPNFVFSPDQASANLNAITQLMRHGTDRPVYIGEPLDASEVKPANYEPAAVIISVAEYNRLLRADEKADAFELSARRSVADAEPGYGRDLDDVIADLGLGDLLAQNSGLQKGEDPS